jgi:hypothetical protein
VLTRRNALPGEWTVGAVSRVVADFAAICARHSFEEDPFDFTYFEAYQKLRRPLVESVDSWALPQLSRGMGQWREDEDEED